MTSATNAVFITLTNPCNSSTRNICCDFTVYISLSFRDVHCNAFAVFFGMSPVLHKTLESLKCPVQLTVGFHYTIERNSSNRP